MGGDPVDALPSELAGPTRHLFLCPHYDDIALSCGGTAALLGRAGLAPEVALLFGAEPDRAAQSPFVARTHGRWGLAASDVVAARRAEEEAAAAILGTRPRYLPFADAIYRGDRYPDDDRLFGPPAADEAGLPARLLAALDLPTAPEPSWRVYAPLGVGGHVDHRHAFAAGAALVRVGWDVWFWEDLPYALTAGTREARLGEVASEEGGAPGVAAIVPVAAAWEARLDAVLAYRSQLAAVFEAAGIAPGRAGIGTLLADYARQAGAGTLAERFWALLPTISVDSSG